MDRDRMIFLLRKIAFLKDVADAQWKHRAFFDSVSEMSTFSIGLRREDVRSSIKSCREELRRLPEKVDKVRSRRFFCRDVIRGMLGIDISRGRKTCYVNFGKHPSATVNKSRSGNSVDIIVGNMWIEKVFRPIYQNASHKGHGSAFNSIGSKMVVLKAERVRVNSPHLELYEVTAFNGNISQTQSGYIAIVKSEERHKVFATTAALALQKGLDLVHRAVTASLEG